MDTDRPGRHDTYEAYNLFATQSEDSSKQHRRLNPLAEVPEHSDLFWRVTNEKVDDESKNDSNPR